MKVRTQIFLVGIMIMTLGVGAIFWETDRESKPTIVEPPKEILPSSPSVLLDAYVPIQKDMVWLFDSDLGEVSVWVDFLKENQIQLRIKTPDTILTRVYLEDEDGIYEVAEIQDTFAKIDYTHLRQYKNPILRFPFEENIQWELEDGSLREVISIDEEVETPFGVVNGIKVKTIQDGRSNIEIYGEQLGLVYGKYNMTEYTNKIQLKDIRFNERVVEQINIYMFNQETGEIEMFNHPVPIRTNEEVMHFMTDILKKVPNDRYLPALPTNVMITNIYVDTELQQVHVELNDSYLHTNYSKAEQNMMMQCLVNTIADYYKVEKVGLTIEGNLHYTWMEKQ